MKKSLWFFIGLATNLVVSSSIIASCGHNVQRPIDDYLNYDQKFGFNQATYNNLVDELRSDLDNKIKNGGKYPNSLDEQKWKDKIAELGGEEKIKSDLENSLSNFHTNFFTENGTFYDSSFNTKTETLINFAKQNYDINLNRQINQHALQNEKDEIKQSYLNYLTQSWEIACKNDPEKATKINDKIGEFNQKFDTWYDEVKQDCNDEATILNKLRIKLIDYIGGVNDELVQISTQNQLKEILHAYRFEVDRDKLDNNNLFWEELKSNDQYNPKDGIKNISTSFDKAFNIFDINDTNIFADKDTEPKKYNGLSDISISGYTLTPYIANLEANPLKNEYYVDLDWQLVNQDVYKERLQKYIDYEKYEDDEEAIKAAEKDENFLKEIDGITAHSYVTSIDDEEPTLQSTLKNNSSQNLECVSSYLWPVSDEYAQKTLFKVFVNNGNTEENQIKFTWLDDRSINGYDTFYSSYDEGQVAFADINSLINCGLQINNRSINDILEDMKTNSDEEIEKDPAKLCLKYCDLSGEYHFSNPKDFEKRNVEVKLNLSYAKNDNISCNPVAASLDKQEQKSTLPVNNSIVKNISDKTYEIFKKNFKIAKDKADLDALEKTLDESLKAVWLLVTLVLILITVVIALIIKIVTICTSKAKKYVDSEDWRVLVNKIIILTSIFAILTVACTLFIIFFINEIDTYRSKVENFKTDGKNITDKFVKSYKEYSQYYEDKEKLNSLQQTNWTRYLEVIGYFNNIENNEDFKKYKQARKDAGAWDIKEFKEYLDSYFWCFAVGLIVAITVAMKLIHAIDEIEKVSRESLSNKINEYWDNFENNFIGNNFLW